MPVHNLFIHSLACFVTYLPDFHCILITKLISLHNTSAQVTIGANKRGALNIWTCLFLVYTSATMCTCMHPSWCHPSIMLQHVSSFALLPCTCSCRHSLCTVVIDSVFGFMHTGLYLGLLHHSIDPSSSSSSSCLSDNLTVVYTPRRSPVGAALPPYVGLSGCLYVYLHTLLHCMVANCHVYMCIISYKPKP